MKAIKIIVALVALYVSNATSHAAGNAMPVKLTQTITMLVDESTKVEYNVDSMGRATQRTLYKMSGEEWVPVHQYKVSFGEDVNTIYYAAWDTKKHDFSRDEQTLALDAHVYVTPIILPSLKK